MTTGRLVYMNGEFVPEVDARISIYDSALMFGDMVFEMTRSFNREHFLLREHLERLLMGVKILRIPLGLDIDDLVAICHETAEKNAPTFSEDDEHRLMINISRGPLSIYAPIFHGRVDPTVVVSDFPLKWTVAGLAHLFDGGINAVTPSQRAIPATLMDPKVKNRSRLWYQMANIEASQFLGDNNWPLLIDTDGFIAEGTGCNFFIAKNNVLYTPQPRNILRGVSRDYVIKMAERLEIQCIEKNIEPYDVYDSDEAFFTATPFCILPVSQFNSLDIGDTPSGPITNLLLNEWSKDVGLDIVKQIQKYAQEVSQETEAEVTPYKFRR